MDNNTQLQTGFISQNTIWNQEVIQELHKRESDEEMTENEAKVLLVKN